MSEGCGSPAGYTAHYRLNTPVCDACRAAQSNYQKIRRRRTGSTQSTLIPLDLLREVTQRLPPDEPIRAVLNAYLV